MKVEMKESMVPSIVRSVILMAVGLLLIFMAEATLISISYLFGGILFAIGAVAIIQFIKTPIEERRLFSQLNIVYGVITILAGILLIAKPSIVSSLVPIFIGIGIIVSSSMKLQQAMMVRSISNSYWKATLISSLLSLICGLVILFNPFKTASIVTQLIGVFILIYSVLDILSTILLRKTTVSINLEVVTPKKEKNKKQRIKDAKIVKEVEKRDEKDA